MTVELQTTEISGNQSVPIQFLRANYTYECRLSNKTLIRDARDVIDQLRDTQEALAHFQDIMAHLPLVPHINEAYLQRKDIADCLRFCIDQAIVAASGED